MSSTFEVPYPPGADPIIVRHVVDRILNRWPPGELKPHFPNVIAALNGWGPLPIGHSMTVGFGDEVYVIGRVK